MAINQNKKSLRGSIALNLFAIAFALMPLFTMGLWTYQQFFSDPRRTQELAYIAPEDKPRLFEEPLISVTFDDGWESIYSQAAPIMSEYGIASTQYILPSQFNSTGYMSANQALSMKNAGHEISSHTYTHKKLTQASTQEIDQEITLSVDVLEQLKLIDDNNRTFAAPNGALNERALLRVKKDFVLARNVNGDLANDISDNDMNVRDDFDRYDVVGYTVGTYTTMDELRGALAYAKKHNAWFVPVYHQIDDSGQKYSVTPGNFRKHMQLFKESGIKTPTVRQIVMHNWEYMR